MIKESPAQRETAGRVMHEFAHGELKSGPRGKGGKVKSRKQAIAIALHEAGASKNESKSKNKQNLSKTKRKEATGKTAQQETEGKTRIGARWAVKTPRRRPVAAARPSASLRAGPHDKRVVNLADVLRSSFLPRYSSIGLRPALQQPAEGHRRAFLESAHRAIPVK
jgi:hypothetical protein